MNKDLRQFLEVAQKAGPEFYVEVKKPLKPKFEPCIIQEKLASESRFPVVYCPEIEDSKLPLVTNLFGSYEMLGLSLGLDPRMVKKADIFKEYKRRAAITTRTKMLPKSEAPVKQVVMRGKDIDLSLLPIIHHKELDSGKYITIGCLLCKDPDTGIPNVGVYRHEVKGKDKLSGQIASIKHGGYISRRYAELGKPMEVVIFLGHHPLVVLAACAGGPLGMNELELAGSLLEETLLVTQGETVDLPVPAFAEIAIEGVIDTRQFVSDGPFAEYTDYYGDVDPLCRLIQVTAITMRKDAIYHDLDPGHREHNLALVLSAESATYEAVKRVVPTLKAVHFPLSGARHHIYISIKKTLQGQGKLAGLAAFTGHLLAKLAVVVDEDVDVYNEEEVLWAVATRMQGDRNIAIIPGVTGSQLDPGSYDETRINRGIMTTKVIIDATKPVGQPFPTRIMPNRQLWDSMKLENYLKK